MNCLAYEIEPGPGWGEFQPGDVVLVDWDKHPEAGEIGCRRIDGDRVRIERANGPDSQHELGKIIRPAEFIKRAL